MKLIIISDSHRSVGNVKKIIEKHPKAAAIIFLGDGESDIEKIRKDMPQLPQTIYQVCGNCDKDSKKETKIICVFEGYTFFITHGHEYGVKSGIEKLASIAANEGCQVALYGHVHKQSISEFNNVTAFNPGSAANGDYGIIKIKEGNIKFKHKQLK